MRAVKYGVLLLSMLATSGCKEGVGRPDEELGDLVIAHKPAKIIVDVDRTTRDPKMFVSMVQSPHDWVYGALGAHRVEGRSRVQVLQGKAIVEDIDDVLAITIDKDGHYSATVDNSKEYGRHVIYDGTSLFLRPRYGRYHQRQPQTEIETSEIRDEIYAGAGDYLEVLAGRLTVTAEAPGMRDGRAVRNVSLGISQEAERQTPEVLQQSQWRNQAVVLAIEGTGTIDEQTGVVVALQFSGRLRFERDKTPFVMTVSASRILRDFGHTDGILAPEEPQRMKIPARNREMQQRNTLLEHIAPPARRRAGT